METHNPAYTIPVVKTMTLVECAMALGFGREAPEDKARPGHAYPDPNDPHSHLRMRKANLEAREDIAKRRHGRAFRLLGPRERAEVIEQAGVVAPEPEARPVAPEFVAALTSAWDKPL